MSQFFESLLSSVTGEPAKPYIPVSKDVPLATKKTTNNPNIIPRALAGTGVSNATSSSLKRKADDLPKPQESKVPKLDESSESTSKGKAPIASSNGVPNKAPKAHATKPDTVANEKSKPLNAQPAKPQVRATATAVPNPNSYAAMMARAAEAHANTKTNIFEIKHVPMDKRFREHKRRAEAIARAKAAEESRNDASSSTKNTANRKSAAGDKSAKRANAHSPPPKAIHPDYSHLYHSGRQSAKVSNKNAPVKIKKKREPLEYKGTMGLRPNGSDKRPSSVTENKRLAGHRPINSSAIRHSETHDDSECTSSPSTEITPPPSNSASDDESSSQEHFGGGFDELEAEEQASLRIAKREDAAALREEETKKREKEERKKRLQALAAKNSKRRF